MIPAYLSEEETKRLTLDIIERKRTNLIVKAIRKHAELILTRVHATELIDSLFWREAITESERESIKRMEIYNQVSAF